MPRGPVNLEARQRGKKVEVYRSQALHHDVPQIPVDVRMDRDGQFSACYLEVWYEAMTLQELHKILDDVIAKVSKGRDWAIYIEIENFSDERNTWQDGRKLDMNWDFDVVSMSDEIDPGGKIEPYRLMHGANVDDETGEVRVNDHIRPQKVDVDPDYRTYVPYTFERWRRLLFIAKTFQEVAKRVEVLRLAIDNDPNVLDDPLSIMGVLKNDELMLAPVLGAIAPLTGPKKRQRKRRRPTRKQ